MRCMIYVEKYIINVYSLFDTILLFVAYIILFFDYSIYGYCSRGL